MKNFVSERYRIFLRLTTAATAIALVIPVGISQKKVEEVKPEFEEKNVIEEVETVEQIFKYRPVILHEPQMMSSFSDYSDIQTEENQDPFGDAEITGEQLENPEGNENIANDSLGFSYGDTEQEDDLEAAEDGEDEFHLYDVPLTEEQQRYVWKTADEFGIDPLLIYGVMNNETNYRTGINSKNGKYIGIMQIAKSNLNTLKKNVGVTNLEDFEQNVKAGAYFLSYYYVKYKDINKTFMCYHCGGGNANTLWEKGVYEDNYCIKANAEIKRLKESYLNSLK